MAAAAGRDEWACERCTYLNTEDALQCVMCEWEEPSRTMTTTPTTRDVHAASHRMPTTAPLALHAVTPPSIATATTTTATNNIIAPPPRVVVARPVHHSVPSARPSSYDNGTWDISIMGLVGRMVTPAKFIFNGARAGPTHISVYVQRGSFFLPPEKARARTVVVVVVFLAFYFSLLQCK